MAPSTIRKAIGAVKDQASIGLAKVSSNIAPELDVAIVKATSHDDEPSDEKYLREILSLTSSSRGYVGACIAAVSKRLRKTRDWIVALKALVLVHRLLSDGDPAFQHEILYATRRGTRLLNMADFRGEAHSGSWDHSAFVRAYALYLDQRLELIIYEQKQGGGGDSNGGRRPYQSELGELDGSYGRSSYSSPPSGGNGDYRYNDRYKSPNQRDEESKPRTPLRDMTPEKVLGKMHQLQEQLDRLLACRPMCTAKNSRMVLVALYPIVRESFQIYADLCEVLAVLLDRFFDMEHHDCVKSFEAYASAAKQVDELAAFYGWCKDIGVARSSEFPEVQRLSDKLLQTLEEFTRDRARRPVDPPREPGPALAPVQEDPVEDMSSTKAHPAPSDYVGQLPKERVEPKQERPREQEGDLVDLREDASAVDNENRLALALFSAGGETSAGNGSWEVFPSENGASGGDGQATSAWQTPAAEEGKADWELALVETASNLSKQKANLAGGFNPLLLNGMYDHGAVRQQVSAQVSGGSASSVALPVRSTMPVLALPAPDGTVQTINEDPFAASTVIPPPSYVQMADMEKKQRLLTREQLTWQQYSQNGMQGQATLARLENGYMYPNPALPYGMPPVHGTPGGYYHPPY